MTLATGFANVTALRRLADLHGNAPAVCDMPRSARCG
jgi:hypothetical protein